MSLVDFKQYKLTKKDWEALEVPGYLDINIKKNYAISLLSYTKLSTLDYSEDYINKISLFIFYRYFNKTISKICKKKSLQITFPKNKNINLKAGDKIRLDNTDTHVCYQDNIIDSLIKGYIPLLIL